MRPIIRTAAMVALVAVTTAVETRAQDEVGTTKLEGEFLGINLGCGIDELQAILKKSEKPMKQVKKSEVDGMTTYLYSGNHRLNGATGTGFSFWDGKLAAVTLYFSSEDAEELYDALKLKMEEKYGKMSSGIQFMGKKCSLTKDGMVFQLQWDKKPLETDSVYLVAGHVGIMAAKEAKSVEDKADALGDLE